MILLGKVSSSIVLGLVETFKLMLVKILMAKLEFWLNFGPDLEAKAEIDIDLI